MSAPAPDARTLLVITTPMDTDVVVRLLGEMPPESTIHASTGAIEVRAATGWTIRRVAP